MFEESDLENNANIKKIGGKLIFSSGETKSTYYDLFNVDFVRLIISRILIVL